MPPRRQPLPRRHPLPRGQQSDVVNLQGIDGQFEAVPTWDKDGNRAWRVRVDGQELAEYLFHRNPSYETLSVDGVNVRVALHETWKREVPSEDEDEPDEDLGVKVVGYVGYARSRRVFSFTASYMMGMYDSEQVEVSLEDGAFKTEDERDAFVYALQEYLFNKYDF